MVQAVRSGKAPPLGELRDVQPLVKRAKAEATLGAENLRDVAETLHGLKLVRNSLPVLGQEFATLTGRATQLHDRGRLPHDIDARIDNRGKVADSASSELARLRHDIEKLDHRIRSLIDRMLRRETIKRVLSLTNFKRLAWLNYKTEVKNSRTR